jgi:hypothetical protein
VRHSGFWIFLVFSPAALCHPFSHLSDSGCGVKGKKLSPSLGDRTKFLRACFSVLLSNSCQRIGLRTLSQTLSTFFVNKFLMRTGGKNFYSCHATRTLTERPVPYPKSKVTVFGQCALTRLCALLAWRRL